MEKGKHHKKTGQILLPNEEGILITPVYVENKEEEYRYLKEPKYVGEPGYPTIQKLIDKYNFWEKLKKDENERIEIELSFGEIADYRKECASFWKKRGYRGELTPYTMFRDAKIVLC